MKVVVGSDHAGFELKEQIKAVLVEKGYAVIDVGTKSPASVDYPDFGIKAATLVGRGEADRGVLVCGTGIGMSVVANKVKGVRAALISDLYTAIQSRKHLDANILVLGGRVIGKDLAAEITRVWLDTPFEGGRHQKRIEKIEHYEKDNLK
ncbi:MAG: sugar-phosphate isomerase, RpiB/LacA/LacB family [Deltaproteobacteria bacterium]|jgi:RpiB/LacA/LacB family sugar-phosphate isomerase|nr:sugar-phosphate isomerase, RpiB/LacA/LacB family [Deltaproteobacteria bacterium]